MAESTEEGSSTTLIEVLRKDTVLQDTDELRTVMLDRGLRRNFILMARTGVRRK